MSSGIRLSRDDYSASESHEAFVAVAQRLAAMVEHAPSHRCDILTSEATWREVTHITVE